jgi:hypothetical protein
MRGYKLRSSVNWQEVLKQECLKQMAVIQGLGVVLNMYIFWNDVVQNLAGRFFTVFMHYRQENCRIIPSLRGHQTLPVFVISAIFCCAIIINMEDSI